MEIEDVGTVPVNRLTLTLRETANVLWPDEDPKIAHDRVRELVKTGRLTDVSVEYQRRVDPQELAQFITEEIAAGRVSRRARVDLAALVASPR